MCMTLDFLGLTKKVELIMKEQLVLGKTQPAKFKGNCGICEENYEPGEYISYTNKNRWIHEECGFPLDAQLGYIG